MDAEHFKKIIQFSAALIETQDLDPVYVALAYSKLKKPQLMRLVLAYSCLYHLGAAAYLSSFKGEEFWSKLYEAAENKETDPARRWPRGSERRHWRGQQALNTVNYFISNFQQPEEVINYWAWRKTFKGINEQVKHAAGYGPWIAFKIADILERVIGYPVDFSDCELGFYSEPRKGAALVLTGDTNAQITNENLAEVVQAMLAAPIGKFMAPPKRDRRINIQEIETCLCKYKSHYGGHYPLGKDTREVYHGLGDPRWGPWAANLRKAVEPLWRQWP